MKILTLLLSILFISQSFAQMDAAFDGKQVFIYRVYEGKNVYARKSGSDWEKVTRKGLPNAKIDDLAVTYDKKIGAMFVYAISSRTLWGRRSGESWAKVTTKGLPNNSRPKHVSARYTEVENIVFVYLELSNGDLYARRSGDSWRKVKSISPSGKL